MDIAAIAPSQNDRFATKDEYFLSSLPSHDKPCPRSPWTVPSPPPYQGGQVLSRLQRRWNSLTAVLVDVRAEGMLRAPLRAGFTRVCIALEEVGGSFEISGARLPCAAPSGRGEISVIPPDLDARGRGDGLRFLRHLMLQMDGPTVTETLGEEVDVESVLAPRLMVSDPRLLALGRLVADECQADDPSGRIYGDSLCVAILAALASQAAPSAAPNGPSCRLTPWQVRRATEYLLANLAMDVELSTLAAIAGLSKSYFCRAFKATTGLPPHRWLLNARVARAKTLLLDGDLPLAEISLLVGFADQAHFTRTFNKIEGTSPRAWQRLRRM